MFLAFQPDPVIALTVAFSWRSVIAVIRNITGVAAAQWERGRPGAGITPSPLGLRDPHKIIRARTVPSPLWGEGKGEGKHAALGVIPFTLCSLLFCHARTCERARVVHRHRPGDPGSRPGKSPLARFTAHIPSGLSGTGEGNVRVKSPSPRIPARRPGLTDTLRRFSAGPCHRGDCFILIAQCYRCKT